MFCQTWLLPLCLFVQVPPPASGQDDATLKEAARSIHQRESKSIEKLAAGLKVSGSASDLAEIRRLLPAGPAHQGATRLTPLPEVVPAHAKGLASVSSGGRTPSEKGAGQDWRREVEQIRSTSATELFALAKRAAAGNSPHLALASVCLREVLERKPDHPEARRLLGYIPYEGGWARPFVANRLKEGNVNHSIFGWVPAEWVPHLDAGELPAPDARGNRKVQWLPAREADALRSNIKHPWEISTEHFEIRADVPLGEAIEFARRLEPFYDIFFTIMADVVGENLPLARRFRSPSLTGESAYRRHQIYYFASKDEYDDYLRVRFGGESSLSLGFYQPPKPGKGNRAPAFFFRDPDGRIAVTATLYHEVSHQLLFETAGPNHYESNLGNYWVFEGLGTYFETVTPRPDGSIEVGGPVGIRLAVAQQLFKAGRFLALDPFIGLDKPSFMRSDLVSAHYEQGMALAVFLMQWNDGTYRDAFLEYAHDAYRGRLKRTTGRSLEDRLGVPMKTVDGQFRAFLAKCEIAQ